MLLPSFGVRAFTNARNFDERLDLLNLPENLESLTLGKMFNQSLLEFWIMVCVGSFSLGVWDRPFWGEGDGQRPGTGFQCEKYVKQCSMFPFSKCTGVCVCVRFGTR